MRIFTAVLVLTFGSAYRVLAQGARDSLATGSEAYDLADYGPAARLLAVGLDPATGPQDSLWLVGVHKLAHTLMELGQGSPARLWARWAVRQLPAFPIDSVNFPPSVVALFDSARSFVGAPSSGDSLTETTFDWRRISPEAPGAIRLEASGTTVSALVESVGALGPQQSRSLPPGSYTVLASADGFYPARVTREVLPGVVTALRFDLRELPPQNPGFLYVVSRPWGTVYIDGRRAGYTTLAAHPVRPGAHGLRIERLGYVTFDTTVTVAADARVRIPAIDLKREPGRE
ncbi:MAG: PEGA domain-containing protein [Gemmatimonadetes bacterium]|nr:PEGA domain-containing protein [Gemmatimonadota bacterium]